MNAAGALVLCILTLVVLCGNRLQALVAMMCGVLFLSEAQEVAFLGVNLFAMRFLETAGCVRVLARHEFSWRNLNRLDWAVIWLYAYSTVVYLLRSSEGAASGLALAADAGLCYVTCRGLIRSLGDFVSFLRILALILVPWVVLLVVERKTGHTPLSFMSAGLEGIFVRDGVPRCMGSFRNPDLLGALGATFLPCFLGLSFSPGERWRSVLGAVLCLAIVWLSHSGGSVSAAGIALVGWMLWPLRGMMRQVRWSLLAGLGLLALVMKAPVWYLLDRVSDLTGGTGWHRAYLIDVAVRHLGQWWLAGMPIRDTQNWFFYTIGVTGGADITNQFLWFGIMAGLGAIVLLIVVVARGFSTVGRAMAAVRRAGAQLRPVEFMLWGLGVLLTVHVVNWFGISYFDQIYVVWLLQLAAISAAASYIRIPPGRPVRPEQEASQGESAPHTEPNPSALVHA
jgi:hypothetical protein